MINLKIEEFKTDLEINEIFNIWKDNKNSILLDSSKYDSKYSKFSFIGINPISVLKSMNGRVFKDDKEIFNTDIFAELKSYIKNNTIHNNYNIPFIAGFIGYISYDMSKQLENINNIAKNDLNLFDAYFVLFENIIIYDLENNKKYITSINESSSIEKIKRLIESYKAESNRSYTYNDDFSKFKSNFEKEEYKNLVSKVKNYIEEGHTYIANLTQRFDVFTAQEGYDIYQKLRCINPAPFSAYMNLEDIEVISSSPERFLNIIDKKVETRPIKGTMPRGKNKKEDDKNREILKNSEKDKSELLMVVDLERNDLSKVCLPNSVKVTELFEIEEYATVFHLVSTIEGILEESKTSVDCIKESFPGGSITGTPKIRTMEIIEELESVRRGIYTGAIGYFDLSGNCDFNIVIRTILKKGNKAYFGVGGGITIESDNESEYQETLDKAKALMRVL